MPGIFLFCESVLQGGVRRRSSLDHAISAFVFVGSLGSLGYFGFLRSLVLLSPEGRNNRIDFGFPDGSCLDDSSIPTNLSRVWMKNPRNRWFRAMPVGLAEGVRDSSKEERALPRATLGGGLVPLCLMTLRCLWSSGPAVFGLPLDGALGSFGSSSFVPCSARSRSTLCSPICHRWKITSRADR